jgi:hypothetical protein
VADRIVWSEATASPLWPDSQRASQYLRESAVTARIIGRTTFPEGGSVKNKQRNARGDCPMTLRRRFQPDVSRWYPRATVKPMSAF